MFTKKTKVINGVITIMFMISFLSGCATTGSRYIAVPSAPPPTLRISSTDDRLNISLDYIIIPNGPGAWVKDAGWDEYVITVRNISDKTLTVERIRLIDPRGLYIDSGINPFQLETLSEALVEQYKDAGIAVVIGAVPAVVTGVAAGAGAIGTAVGAATVGVITAPLVPIYLLGRQHAKVKDQEAIIREFTRRRLSTFTLSGNATISGSVFFPIIPNPKALVVNYRIGNDMKVLEVPLEKLKGLHTASAKNQKE